MKKLISITVLLLAVVSTAFAQTNTGSPGSASTDKPVAGSPNKKESAVAQESAAITSANAPSPAATEKRSSAPSDSDEATLTSMYRVGVGDVLDIRLLNSATNKSTLFTVMDGGIIDFPLVGGSMVVDGLTTDEIQTKIVAELNRRAVQDKAALTVGVRQYASHTVIVTGLVGIPGTKTLRREAVPLYVILAESQPRLDANQATVMRSDKLLLTVDLSEAASLGTLIRPGDVINLTTRPKEYYYIAGYVNNPGQKDFQAGITLLQAILAAGGLARPQDNIVELSREGAEGRLSTTRYNLREIKSGKVQDPRLQAGDRIEVVR